MPFPRVMMKWEERHANNNPEDRPNISNSSGKKNKRHRIYSSHIYNTYYYIHVCLHAIVSATVAALHDGPMCCTSIRLAPAQIVRKRNFFPFSESCTRLLADAYYCAWHFKEISWTTNAGARIFERPATAPAASAPLAARDEVTRIL